MKLYLTNAQHVRVVLSCLDSMCDDVYSGNDQFAEDYIVSLRGKVDLNGCAESDFTPRELATLAEIVEIYADSFDDEDDSEDDTMIALGIVEAIHKVFDTCPTVTF